MMLIKLTFLILISFHKASDTSNSNYENVKTSDDAGNQNEEKGDIDYISLIKTTLGLFKTIGPYITPQNIAIGAAISGATYISYKVKNYYAGQNKEEFNKEWDKQRNQIINDEIETIKNLFEKEKKKNIEKVDKSIYENEIKEFLEVLKEEKKKATTNYTMDYISSSLIEENIKGIKRINILSLGNTKIGKTTLINEILFLDEKHKGKVGDDAKSTTMEDTPFISDFLKHIKIIDSRGIEIDEFNMEKWLEKYKGKMEENTKKGNFDELIHCIWYCVSGNVMNDGEIKKIKKINSLFNKFQVPIIFVYLKPFIANDIINIKKETTKINNNFISVQSIDFINKCKENDENCFHEPQFYPKKNMDKLLYMTKDLVLDGIINSVSSRTIYYLKDGLEQTIQQRFDDEFYIFEELLNNITKNLKQGKSLNNIIPNIDEKREEFINKIIKIIEFSLFGGKNKISKKTEFLIKSIHKNIEKKLNEILNDIYNSVFEKEKEKIKNVKQSSHEEYKKNTFFGCNDLKDNELNNDYTKFKQQMDTEHFVEIYSMILSFEIMDGIFKKDILEFLKYEFIKILNDASLINIIKENIKKKSEKGTKVLLNELEKEIKIAFGKKNKILININKLLKLVKYLF